jgi:hypothetical protein
MNLFNGRLAKKPQSLDAAYERHAMEQGLVDKPIFPENMDWGKNPDTTVWKVVTNSNQPFMPGLPNYNTEQEKKMQEQELKKETDVNSVLQERGNRYGKFEDNARISQDLKDVCTGGQELHPVFKEALDNICQKIARVVNGDQFYEDNWVDIQGYAKLALDYIREHK